MNKRVKRAIAYPLIPLVRILIHFNIDYATFSTIVKRTFVYVSSNYPVGIKGKCTNTAIEEKTGIPRKEVAKLQKLNEEDPLFFDAPLSVATKVVGAWQRNDLYIDDNQQPISIPVSNQVVSFESLVRDFGNGQGIDNVLAELIELGLVERLDSGHLKLVNRSAIPLANSVDRFDVFSRHLANMINTGRHNVTQVDSTTNFQRSVTFDDVPENILEAFKAYSNKRSEDILIEYNQWFHEKLRNKTPDNFKKRTRAGVGIYYFDNMNKKE